MSIIKKAKEDSYKNQLSMIEKMAETYIASEMLTFDKNNQATFTLEDMMQEKIAPSNITDPRCGKSFLPTETVFTVTKDDKNNLDYSLTLDTACDIDVTPPTINSVSEEVSYNSIKVVVNAIDNIGVKKYLYSKNGEEYIEGSSIYTFENLMPQTTYTIKVKVINKVGL